MIKNTLGFHQSHVKNEPQTMIIIKVYQKFEMDSRIVIAMSAIVTQEVVDCTLLFDRSAIGP